MFADDLELRAMTRQEVRTRGAMFDRHVLKICRTKTQYWTSPTNDTESTVKIVEAELPAVKTLK